MNNDVLIGSSMVSFAETTIGYSHTKVGKECEDSSGFYANDNVYICVVADGHGSKQYFRTKKGSSFAVDAAITNIKEFSANIDKENFFKNSEMLLRNLAQSILNKWLELVRLDYIETPFSEEELNDIPENYKIKYADMNNISYAYGTTLIAFVITKDYSFGLQLGDGKCVILNSKGEYILPIPWDEKCQMNVTTSLCDKNALQEFRFYLSDKSPIAVFCGTDGIEDSYVGDEELIAFYKGVLTIFARYGYSVGVSEVREYLPILTKNGSMDDVSIAGIIDMDRAKTFIMSDENSELDINGSIERNTTDNIMKAEEVKSIFEKQDEVDGDERIDISSNKFNEEKFNECIHKKALRNSSGNKDVKRYKYAIGLAAFVGIGILIKIIKGNKR